MHLRQRPCKNALLVILELLHAYPRGFAWLQGPFLRAKPLVANVIACKLGLLFPRRRERGREVDVDAIIESCERETGTAPPASSFTTRPSGTRPNQFCSYRTATRTSPSGKSCSLRCASQRSPTACTAGKSTPTRAFGLCLCRTAESRH